MDHIFVLHALTEIAKPRKRNCSARLLILALHLILYGELGYGRNYWPVILTENASRLFLTCTRELIMCLT